MRIAYKVPIFLLVFMIAFSAAMLVFENVIIEPGLEKIEFDDARRDQGRVISAIGREEKQISLTARDWGQWDDCYKYMQGTKPSFVADNIDADTYKTTQLDIIVIYGLDGKLRYSGRADPANKAVIAQTLFPQRAEPGAPYMRSVSTGVNVTGILRSGDEAFIMASSPILPNDGDGPPLGCIIMNRVFTPTLVSSLADQTEVPISIATTTVAIDTSFHKSADGKKLEGTTTLNDLRGKPALLVKTETERKISTKGMASLLLFRNSIFASCVLFSLALIGALARMVAHPISAIQKVIGETDSEEEAAMPKGLLRRRDELGALANAFSQLSARLSEKRRELEEANSGLERKVEERTYELSLMANVVNATSQAVVLTDLEGRIIKVNAAFCQISGYSELELLGQNPRIMKSGKHDAPFYKLMWRALLENGTWSGEIWDKKKNGDVFPKWLTINLISDQEGLPRNYVGVATDISEIKATEEKLHHLAYFDPLTGLPNRSLFRDRLERAVARSARSGACIGVVFIDLDRFKYVNDTMGHAAGDKLLIEVSRRFVSKVRNSDTVSRFGGDEFTLILDGIRSGKDAAKVAEHILDEISAPVILDGSSVFIGASIGIATYPMDDTTPEGLMRKADAAMYSAKESGRNRYRFASGKTESDNRERLELDLGLRRALESSELLLYYQPILDSRGERLLGAEALLRWKRPGSGEPCLPERAIALAEESGLIVKIGEFVMREACRQAAEWAATGRGLPRISVNVSARQFENAGLITLVRESLAESRLPPSCLDIELTESALMSDMELALRTMLELKSIGVSLSVDDFGTGYASLSYLSRFPVDRLKIDRSFIREMETNPASSALIDAILAMAGSLGISTLAEGVETEGQRRRLQEKGCAELQGFLFSKPVHPRVFAENFQTATVR